MTAFLGIPDMLPYFNLIDHNTIFGFFLGAGGLQATWRAWRRYKHKTGPGGDYHIG